VRMSRGQPTMPWSDGLCQGQRCPSHREGGWIVIAVWLTLNSSADGAGLLERLGHRRPARHRSGYRSASRSIRRARPAASGPPGSRSARRGAALRVAPELSDPVGSLQVGEHQDVEQLGAGSRTEGVEALLWAAFELIRTHLVGRLPRASAQGTLDGPLDHRCDPCDFWNRRSRSRASSTASSRSWLVCLSGRAAPASSADRCEYSNRSAR
jgi:hypothetical protein